MQLHASPSATVAICAYTMRRWDNLVEALTSVVGQLRDGDECVIVVDHNEELLQRARIEFAGLPSARVIANASAPGVSGARNTAVSVSHGAIIAFLDDDAVASDRWLDRMRSALGEVNVLGAGSAALPAWPDGGRPSWFPPEFDWVIGCSYVGTPTVTTDVRNVLGAAMAFRRTAFDLAGPFSAMVGRIGTVPTGCEETEFCIRLRRADPTGRIMYLPDVTVAHRITPERLTLRYFLRRCIGEGLSKARVARLVGADEGLSSERTYVRRTIPLGVVRELGRGLRGQWGGWPAAALIVVGVLATGLAYVGARLWRGADDQRPGPTR